MKEYIEREEAERVAMYVAVEKDHAKELIQRIPAANVAEVRHAKFVDIAFDDMDEGMWKCSACNDERYYGEGSPSEYGIKYCPNCGAKMDKEE